MSILSKLIVLKLSNKMRFLCRHEQVGVLMLIRRQMLSGNSSQISAVCGKVNLEIIFSDRFSVEPFQAESHSVILHTGMYIFQEIYMHDTTPSYAKHFISRHLTSILQIVFSTVLACKIAYFIFLGLILGRH